jgi:hypothetical protein
MAGSSNTSILDRAVFLLCRLSSRKIITYFPLDQHFYHHCKFRIYLFMRLSVVGPYKLKEAPTLDL